MSRLPTRLPCCILRSAFCISLSLALSSSLLALPPDLDPSLFPGANLRSSDEIQLAGLSVLYPGRILRAPPITPDPSNANRTPLAVDLPGNLTYLRIYDLKAALPKLADLLARPALILDLRYVGADAPDSAAFAATLAKAGLASTPVKALGDLPAPPALPPAPATTANNPNPPAPPLVLALVNRQTSGPLEAWLAAFQDASGLFAVGTPTAGQPGFYRSSITPPGYYIIAGELQPASGSLDGAGLQPRFPVDITPEQNYRVYDEVERGVEIPALLRHEPTLPDPTPAPPASNTTASPTSAPAPAAETEDTGDPVLQRAVDVVAALQLLGRVPSLSAPATPAQPTTQPAKPGP